MQAFADRGTVLRASRMIGDDKQPPGFNASNKALSIFARSTAMKVVSW